MVVYGVTVGVIVGVRLKVTGGGPVDPSSALRMSVMAIGGVSIERT
jgi:hypothetical protein